MKREIGIVALMGLVLSGCETISKQGASQEGKTDAGIANVLPVPSGPRVIDKKFIRNFQSRPVWIYQPKRSQFEITPIENDGSFIVYDINTKKVYQIKYTKNNTTAVYEMKAYWIEYDGAETFLYTRELILKIDPTKETPQDLAYYEMGRAQFAGDSHETGFLFYKKQ